LADSLGIPITAEKTQYPTIMITIYGIAIDSIEMVARLSVNKVEKNISLIYCQIQLQNLHELTQNQKKVLTHQKISNL
jgi:hypothetical protein